MRLNDHEERAPGGLFEQWMGLTLEEWEALGQVPDADRVTDETLRP